MNNNNRATIIEDMESPSPASPTSDNNDAASVDSNIKRQISAGSSKNDFKDDDDDDTKNKKVKKKRRAYVETLLYACDFFLLFNGILNYITIHEKYIYIYSCSREKSIHQDIPHLTMHVPSRLKSTPVTGFECAGNVATHSPHLTSHNFTVSSND